MNSNIRHGETDMLENMGRKHISVYRDCTIYSTLSCCIMCSSTILFVSLPLSMHGLSSVSDRFPLIPVCTGSPES
jgi:creatinine deaminase